jgi:hypothetical protein
MEREIFLKAGLDRQALKQPAGQISRALSKTHRSVAEMMDIASLHPSRALKPSKMI